MDSAAMLFVCTPSRHLDTWKQVTTMASEPYAPPSKGRGHHTPVFLLPLFTRVRGR
jgi:hypothetical protein